ncbi:basic helix-loop-helix domain-containing protein USF3 isoform X2 [Pseudonaja textilis]|uniref:Upstream transcription factor family member 3 n=1 Tax=Pseudonaja textilis TaxID=8673 RepID=A0A670ZD28_PSETE|nr:basic helix-loop-helix domain-containing protein USF3 isoform X2 [Pseudonaja textilis]
MSAHRDTGVGEGAARPPRRRMVPSVGLQLLSPPYTPSILLPQTMTEMTEKAPLKKQHRKKNRETHNAVERHRKKKINAGINRIGELIPCSPALKQSKNMILDQAYKYITEMKKQNDELLLNGGNNEQAEEIKKLRKQLDELQKENGRYIALLKANDICLYDDPTIHWKGNLKNSNVSIVIPNDQTHKKKENLKNTNISVVIPNDQLQKNIIVYSNGSQFGGSNQGPSVQGITFNIGHNLQKQTANVVPVQRTCNTPATISSIYSTAIKSGIQTSVSSLVSGLPNTDKKTLEQSTSEDKQGTSTCTSAASSVNTSQLVRLQSGKQISSQDENDISKSKNKQGSLKLIEETSVPSPSLSSSVSIDVLHCQQENIPTEVGSRSGSLGSCVISAADPACAASIGKASTGKVFKSLDDRAPEETPKAVTELNIAPATTVEKWSFPSSSGVGIPESKSIGNLMRITSAGNTQTTWTTLQLAGSTVQPLNHTPSNIMTALLNEPINGASIIASTPNKILANAAGLNNPLIPDEHPVDQLVVGLPSYPSLPIQPLISKTQPRAQIASSLLPVNPAMQVIQVSQPITSPINTSPINQNIVILQPPNANSCPPVLRAELPNQTVSQQIVIIQTANPNPLSFFSTPPVVKMPVNGTNSGNLIQSASGPHMFGGKHLVHILPRPSSSTSSCLTQTFSVSMSNQKLPQTISLNGQLFALKPMKSCSGDSDQTPMQIIQPTTSEDPNTNIALNAFGALANLNQSISQMAGQSCQQVSGNPSTNPKTVSSQTTPISPALLTVTVPSSSAAESSRLTCTSTSLDISPPKAASSGSKWSNKNAGTKKTSVASNSLACQVDPEKECKKIDRNMTTASEHSGSDILLENMPVLQCLAVPQANCRISQNDIHASDPHTKDRLRAEQNMESTLTPDLNAAGVPRSLSLESSLLGQFEVVPAISTDRASPPLQICKSQTNSTANSKLSELSKCISTSPLLPSSSDSPVTISQISETSVSNRETNTENVPRTEVSEICRMEQNCSIVMQASDLLEEQGLTKMFSEFNKVGDVQKSFSVEHPSFCTQSTKSNISSDDNLGRKQELLLINAEEENLTRSNSCTSDQEAITANRQVDSPMSTSSGSSCGFSVASMLPDTCRENVSNSTLVNTHSTCSFSEQTDIVALAARAIFDQETLAKNTGTVSGTSISKGSKVTPLGRDQPFKAHPVKNTNQMETGPNNFSTQNSMQINIELSAEKSCSVRLEMADTALQIPTPQPSNTSSLNVNNLIHPTCIIHPPVSCSGVPSSSDRTTVSVSGTPSVPANSYMTQSPGHSPRLMAEYPSEQLSALQTSTMQGPQICEPHLKQQRQSRKESAKRSVQDDHMLSTSKRQKHCQTAPLQLEDMALLNQTADDIEGQNQIRVNPIAPNSSNLAVSVSNQGHTNGHSRLFQASNFVSPTSRQAEVQCNSHPPILDQAGQHLQPIQHALSQSMAHLQANHPYIKPQQQQAGQLRERHQLYQLQHYISPAESSVHSQTHIAHQQRLLHQEAQLQKKRSLIQATQPTALTLQQKHHGNDQSRSKSSQPHPHHSQIQQLQQHYPSSQPEKNCENSALSRTHSHPRSHPSQDILHQQSSDVGSRQPGSGVPSEHVSGHSQMHRMLNSRALEQQIVSQPSIVSRPDVPCLPHRQERNRVSSYSAEALIGKSSSNSEHRLGVSMQSFKVSDHLEMRNYADISRNKELVIHNTQSRVSVDHPLGSDIQRLSECQTFKVNAINQQPTGNFDVQSSRSNEISNSLRGMQTQSFRLAQNAGPPIDRQKRLSYQPVQSISAGNPLPPQRDNENTCHQGFMQSLLIPHLGDQANGSQRPISEHQRNPQCASSSNVDYNCAPARESIHIRREGDDQNRESCDMSLGTINSRNNALTIPFSSSSGDIQGRNSSPNISIQKSNSMRITESHGTKGHINASASSNVHGATRLLHYAPVSRGNADQVPPSVRQTNSSATDRSRHPLQDNSGSKIRQSERNRSANQRHGNVFEPSLPQIPLSTGGGMILGRQQPTLEKRGSIVRFMPEGPHVSHDSTAVDQHTLSQNFGFPFIPESGMNPPVNANTSFIPPVTQPNATRTAALIPVDPQNTLPSFYPPYSPAHPPLSNDISIPYFSNQMFSNPSTEKPNGGGLNNRFGSILSPPRPVGFAQPSFPLLTDMPPMHVANSSHLSNFNLTSLFPEIATALPSDGSAISPLLSIANTSGSDSLKQSSNRPAHNISHILGHDCSSAV